MKILVIILIVNREYIIQKLRKDLAKLWMEIY